MASITPIHTSAQSFLTHLSLPHNHNEPISHAELSYVGEGVFELPPRNVFHTKTATTTTSNTQPTPPIVGPMSLMEMHNDSYIELYKTLWTMTAPTLAMMELWLRLFALLVGPIGVLHLLRSDIQSTKNGDVMSNKTMITAVLAVASSAVLFTDSLYVYEYGRVFGCSLFILASILAVRLVNKVKRDATKHNGTKKDTVTTRRKANIFLTLIYGLIFTTTFIYLRSDGGHAIQYYLEKIPHLSTYVSATTSTYNPIAQVSDPGIDLPIIQPGFYYSKNNPLIQSIAKNWDETQRTYNSSTGATPYLVNGDQRTGIPFLVNKVKEQEYIRVYVRNPFDDESIALDIAFPYSSLDGNSEEDDETTPPSFVHNLDMPVYLVLHGLNGGSHEEYVKDFVSRRRSEGSTVIVMIARGMMNTGMKGWNVFHGARTGDVDISARAVKRGLDELAKSYGVERQTLACLGYSMGAIILSNYVARSGKRCALDTAIAVSGGLDMRQQLNFRRSMRLWQPMLTMGLREDILLGKYARHYRHRLTTEQFMNLLRVTSISHLDVEAIVTYNNFDDLVHYYSEMSAMGDRQSEFQLFKSEDATCEPTNTEWGRIANVSIPFLVLQALDDPLVGWRTLGTGDVQALADSGSGNTALLLTKAGGHVGWPLGNNPKKEGWRWMNDVGRDFVLAFVKAKKDNLEHEHGEN